MRILNASNHVISVMVDNGALITILPGRLSQVMIASTNIIQAAINSVKSNSQLGIIIGSSIELDIARKITGSIPFIYQSEKEAMKRLLGVDSVDELQSKPSLNPYQLEYEKKCLEFTELSSAYDQLKMSFDSRVSSDIELENLKDEKAKLSADLTSERTKGKGLLMEFNALESELKDSKTKLSKTQDSIRTYEASFNELLGENKRLAELNKSLEIKVEELTSTVKETSSESDPQLTELQSENSKLKEELANVNKNYTELSLIGEQAVSKIEELTSKLTESDSQIETMREKFNSILNSFNIKVNESGELYQDSED